MKLLSKFEVHPPPELVKMFDEGKHAFAVGRLTYGHLNTAEWITAKNIHKYQIMKENLYYDYVIAMATKTWPLMEQFNTLTMRTTEAELGHYQELESVYEFLDYHVQTVAANSRSREPSALRILNINDIFGGCFILGLGLLVALIVFILELFSAKSKRRKQQNTWLQRKCINKNEMELWTTKKHMKLY